MKIYMFHKFNKIFQKHNNKFVIMFFVVKKYLKGYNI